MKTIIAGSRDFFSYPTLLKAVVDSGFVITEVVSGKANGVDMIGERWAKEHGVPVKEFPANWKLYGKAAGPIRNAQMAAYAEQCIVIRYKMSKGATSMINEATKRGLKLYVVDVEAYKV